MDERHVGGLWCHEVLAHLDALIDGELDPVDAAAAHAHVAECDACAAFGRTYATLVQGLRDAPMEALDADQLARVRRRLRQTP